MLEETFSQFRKEFVIIAGPCAVESEEQLMEIAKFISSRGIKFLRGGAFKPRTSPESFQGLGLKGLEILSKAKKEYGLKKGHLGKAINEALLIWIEEKRQKKQHLLSEYHKEGLPEKVPWLLQKEELRGQKSKLPETGYRKTNKPKRN